MTPSVTLETKCWERDWEKLLCTDRLKHLADRSAYPFVKRLLMINNVADLGRVVSLAQAAVADGRITDYVVVQEHAAAALDFFDLTAADLGRGYVYSIAELVSIYLCETDYLLHFAGDCLPRKRSGWVAKAIDVLAADPRVRVANLSWDTPDCPSENTPAREASFGRRGDFFLGYGFSDQCYLIRTRDFRSRIYGESNAASDRYPLYGGELFEKRVDAWMRNHDFLRATYIHAVYDHEVAAQSLRARLRRRAIFWRRSVTHAIRGTHRDER